MRDSKNQGCKASTLIVTAWANKNELILGQMKIEDKSNERTAPGIIIIYNC